MQLEVYLLFHVLGVINWLMAFHSIWYEIKRQSGKGYMMNKCPKCNSEYENGQTECLKCGIIFKKYNSLQKKQNAKRRLSMIRCKTCNKEISETASFCPHCGESDIVKNSKNNKNPSVSPKFLVTLTAIFGTLWIITIFANFTKSDSAKSYPAKIKVRKDNTINIVSCKIHPHVIEFVLDQVLNENSDVRYIIKIETRTGFILDGNGFLTTSTTFDQPTEKWRISAFSCHRRHDSREKWERIEKEVNPGNIRRVSIILKTMEKVIAEKNFENL